MGIIIMNDFLTVANIPQTIYILLRYILFAGQNETSLLIVHLHIGVISQSKTLKGVLQAIESRVPHF